LPFNWYKLQLRAEIDEIPGSPGTTGHLPGWRKCALWAQPPTTAPTPSAPVRYTDVCQTTGAALRQVPKQPDVTAAAPGSVTGGSESGHSGRDKKLGSYQQYKTQVISRAMCKVRGYRVPRDASERKRAGRQCREQDRTGRTGPRITPALEVARPASSSQNRC